MSAVPTRTKSANVTSRLFEPTAASRSRLAANTKSAEATDTTRTAMPLSLAPRGGAQTTVAHSSRATSPSASRRVATARVHEPPTEAPNEEPKTATAPVKSTRSSSVSASTSQKAPPTGARYRTPTRPTSSKVAGSAITSTFSPSSPTRPPPAPSPARFASPGKDTGTDTAQLRKRPLAQQRVTPKRTTSPAVSSSPPAKASPKATRSASASPATAPSPHKETKALKASHKVVVEEEIAMSPLQRSPSVPKKEGSLTRSSSIKRKAAPPLMTPEDLMYKEDLTRVELMALEEADRQRGHEDFLTSHMSYLNDQIAMVNRYMVSKEKLKLHGELQTTIAHARADIGKMRQAIADFRGREKEKEALKGQLAALRNYGKLRSAKIRQKQATMEFLQKTTTELATSGNVLIANLFVEIEELSDIADRCAKRHHFSDSKYSLPLECMAALTEVDFMRELKFEGLVREVDLFKGEGKAISDEMRTVRQRGQELLADKEVVCAAEHGGVLKAWEAEKKKLEKESKVLRKEITDLNFQIRRGSNIKSLSQLPISNNQLERNRVRELYLDTETQRQELEALRLQEAHIQQERLTMQTYHANKEEDATAVLRREVKERTKLETIKDGYREEIVRLQRAALMFATPETNEQLQWKASDGEVSALPPSGNALDDIDIDEDEGGAPTVQEGTLRNGDGEVPAKQIHIQRPAPMHKAEVAQRAEGPNGMKILTADEALRILADIEAADEARQARSRVGRGGGDSLVGMNDISDAFATTPQLTPVRGRSRTPTGSRRQGGPSLLDRLCKPTKQFAAYIDARVQEDASRREISIHLNDGRPDARR